MAGPELRELLDRCIAARAALFDAAHESAFRIFNGFTEGCPGLVIDLYGSTAVLSNHADPPEQGRSWNGIALDSLKAALPWLRAVILKTRNARSPAEKQGRFLFGDHADEKIREHGVWYAVRPFLHQDAGLYLDTRNLRRWALQQLKGKNILNAFSYTGSLGVAALAGGASRVIQLDRNRAFLDVAKASCGLNGLLIRDEDFIPADFFRQAGAFKQSEIRFDCVFLDPPFFAASSAGVVDQVRESARLINKVRPLVEDGGTLVAINNALYVSGREYLQTLEALCADGYLKIMELIPVPEDFTGYAGTRLGALITDPAPFNHSTKIAVLGVKRKH
ncbi:MAG TPA: class I SAM-dependent methyltransferase [Anaerolineales bacterium]